MKLSDNAKRLLRTAVLVVAGLAIGYGLLNGSLTLGNTSQGSADGGESVQTDTTNAQTGTGAGSSSSSSAGTGAGSSTSTSTSTDAQTGTPTTSPVAATATSDDGKITVSEDGTYSARDEVALYIHAFGHLPANFITKAEAEALGWTGGSLEPYAPGKSIGGDWFGNYQSLLPKAKGREWHECDIGTQGKSSRGSKRIVYSNDGLIYYTSDHYESFTQLY